MSFDTQETSAEDGRPLRLYTFARGAFSWKLTDISQDITFMGDIYESAAITMDTIVQSGDAKSEELKLELPATASICQYLDANVPSKEVTLTIRKIHLEPDPLTGVLLPPTSLTEAPVIWIGEVIGVGRPSVLKRTLVCNTLSLSMSRGGLRLTWVRTCPHALYFRGCNVDKAAFAVSLPAVTVLNGIEITADAATAYADGYFSGGFMEWATADGIQETVAIEAHVGNKLTLMNSTRGMADGTNFIAYPGCKRTPQDCTDRFNNMVNYGGINHLQGRSPFDGSPVF